MPKEGGVGREALRKTNIRRAFGYEPPLPERWSDDGRSRFLRCRDSIHVVCLMPMSRLHVSALLILASLSACSLSQAQEQERLAEGPLRHIEVLADDAMRGRPAGDNADARAYILNQFRAYGLRTFGGGYEMPFSFTSRQGAAVEAVNLVGYLEGRVHPDSFIVVSAHYDHLGVRDGAVYNGADDNASGVAALLAAVAHFREHPPQHSIVFAAFDAEEMGLQGARQFVAEPPMPLDQIVLNVNFDMLSESDARELYTAGTHHYPHLRPHLEAVAERAPIHLRFGHDTPDLGPDDWTSASDHGAFHAAGIPFVYFGVEDHPRYHQPSDDYALIDHDFYLDVVATVIDAVATLDAALAE